MNAHYPTGTVTFLLTDIEGSTKLAQEYPDRMPALLARHHEILNQSIRAQNGYVFLIVGDSFEAAFHNATEALRAAIEIQQSLQTSEFFANAQVSVRVRMGIHTGAAQAQEDGQYSGYATLATTQRIMSAGHGGQILLSGATRELVRDSLPADSELIGLGEKRLKDLLRPEHLFQLNIAGLLSTFPPLKTLDSFPNNLPTQLTSFIGRENEIAEVKQELESHRLVTLTGSGGVGKTRLSLQVAAELLDKFEHGVWFIELAPLTDPDLIPQTTLLALGVQGQQGKPPMEVLKDYLHEKQMLLILDNCEHLVSASAKVANELLNAAPRLKIMASSREALGVKGEASYPVPSLSLPDMKHLPVIEQLSQYEAVRLFIDRALLVAPHFAVDKDSAPFIAQICYRLDGIPLAIELAVARVKMLSVEQISKRLDDRFRLLTGGARTALPRQQTLRALIDWSYDILPENERLLLRRLSVFAGGWTLEAAEEVCSDSDRLAVNSEQSDHRLLITDILDLLTQLVNKSLVVVIEHSRTGETRYRMLETIRQYAREKMLEIEDATSLHERHSDWCLKLAQAAELHLEGAEAKVWLDRLQMEQDNLRVALEWSLDANPIDALRLAVQLGRFWLDRDFFTEGRDFIERARNIAQEAPVELRAKALQLEGQLAINQGDYEIAKERLNEGLSLAQQVDDKYTVAAIFNNLGIAAWSQGDYISARNDFEQALELRRAMGNLARIAGGLTNLGIVAFAQEDYLAAKRYQQESEGIFRELGNKRGLATALNNLGLVAEALGDHTAAHRYYQESLDLSQAMDSKVNIAYTLNSLAHLMLLKEDFASARNYYLESLAVFKEIGEKRGLAYCFEGLAMVGIARGSVERAAFLLAFAEKSRENIGSPLSASEKTEYTRAVAATREKLDQELFSAVWAKGRSMTMEQAMELALAIA
ncbi:MAG: tetratricopeptide repeat protein [Caldilineales bacterium]|nr:tetratricopeptide repeat protein [Caldilineales bacterium]